MGKPDFALSGARARQAGNNLADPGKTYHICLKRRVVAASIESLMRKRRLPA
jgi:hypothetical protein